MKKLGHIIKLLLPKFRSDLFVRVRHIAEKHVPAKLKPIVVTVAAGVRPFNQDSRHEV